MTLPEFEHQLKQCDTVAALDRCLSAVLSQLGIRTFSFTYYATTPGSTNALQHEYASPTYRRWHEHYREEGYDDIDSTFDAFKQTTLPIYFDVAEQIRAAAKGRERTMREDSYAFGARCGLIVPITNTHGELATMVVIQMAGEDCLADWMQLQYELFVIAHLYMNYLQVLLSRKTKKVARLSRRETQCLQLVEKNFTVKTIAKQLGITERTVNFHLQNANKKLGVKNKYQAVLSLMRQVQ